MNMDAPGRAVALTPIGPPSNFAAVSRLPFELLLAFRYLRPKRTFVSVITLISIIGVMLGVAVLIVVISVMTGFDRQLRDRLLGFKAHLTVRSAQGSGLADYRELIDRVAAHKSVRHVSPFLGGLVLAESEPDPGRPLVRAPFVRGVHPRLEAGEPLFQKIIRGTNDLRGQGVLIGSSFAADMELDVGDSLAVYSVHDLQKMREAARHNAESEDALETRLATQYEVRGIFDLGYYDFDAHLLVCSLVNAQELFGTGDEVAGLAVTLHDAEQARIVARTLENELGPDYEAVPWQEDRDIALMLQALVVEKNVMFYLLFFIMIVAAFGITSALITFVVQKTREIGILKALGAGRGQIAWLFLSQSIVVGVLGVCAGLMLGLLAVHYRNEFLLFMRRMTRWELFPAEIYQFTELPAVVDPGDLLLICGGSLFICLLAGVLPAWNAGRLKPVEALRHE